MTTNNITQEQIDEALDLLRRAALNTKQQPPLGKWQRVRDCAGTAEIKHGEGYVCLRTDEEALGHALLNTSDVRALIPVLQQFLEDQA